MTIFVVYSHCEKLIFFAPKNKDALITSPQIGAEL